jgi:hypothetical protein
VPQAPTVKICVSGGAPEAMLSPTTRTGLLSFAPRKPDILTPSRFTSAESFSSCCDSVAALALFFDSVAALALASCNEQWSKRMFRDRTRPHLACFARCPPKVQSSRGLRNNLTFSFGKHARTTCISLFPGQTTTRSFLHFPSSAPFFSRVLPTSKLLFRARLYTCRRASAVVRWVPS